MRKPLLALATLAIVAAGAFGSMANAADHRDTPLAQNNQPADINDVYLFRSPANNNNAVGVITLNPLIAPADNNTRGVFDPSVQYQVHIDRNGDLLDDVTVNIRMTSNPPSLILEGFGAAPITAPITPPGASTPIVTDVGGLKVFAGLRDDPFFFDLVAFQAFLAGPRAPSAGLRLPGGGSPADTFAGMNTLAIVFEAPIVAITGAANANSGTIKSWVSTTRGGSRIDRMGIPVINTALIPSARKEAFNQGDPANDAATFREAAKTTIDGLRAAVDPIFGGPLTQNGGPLGNLTSAEVAGALIPDIVTVDFSKPVQFPNGRRLQDDVIDAALGVVLNRGGAAGIGDAIGGNDKAFGSAFPYLADPHTAGGAAPAAPAGGAPTAGGAPAAGGAAPSAGGQSIMPPSTGDGNLLDNSTAMWTLSGVFFVIAFGLGGAGVFAVGRNRR